MTDRKQLERYEDALRRIAAWADASGMTLDAISADAMRHVVEGVGKIAKEALGE